ncbi:hypothetical protein M0R45_009071 [Rubus argutus]|uniref:Uncharacterized protein n=1 Tax=Rubus argutus TaxID=59490 RepID=A0AAW1Y3G0_RUBAR
MSPLPSSPGRSLTTPHHHIHRSCRCSAVQSVTPTTTTTAPPFSPSPPSSRRVQSPPPQLPCPDGDPWCLARTLTAKPNLVPLAHGSCCTMSTEEKNLKE